MSVFIAAEQVPYDAVLLLFILRGRLCLVQFETCSVHCGGVGMIAVLLSVGVLIEFYIHCSRYEMRPEKLVATKKPEATKDEVFAPRVLHPSNVTSNVKTKYNLEAENPGIHVFFVRAGFQGLLVVCLSSRSSSRLC
eukprot:277944-Amphidinium_carterae.2